MAGATEIVVVLDIGRRVAVVKKRIRAVEEILIKSKHN